MSRAVRVLQRGGDARLVALPYAGGSSAAYVRLARELRGIEVVGVDPPGRGKCPGPALTRYDELVAHYVRALAPVLHDAVPTALFGHSLGALAAYGVTRKLLERGRLPLALFVSGCVPITEPRRGRDWSRASDDDLLQLIRDFAALPDDVTRTPSFRALALESFRADLQVHAGFRVPDDATLPLPLRVLAGRDDLMAAPAAMRRWAELAVDTEFVTCPGTHMFVVQHAAEVAAIVSRMLAKLLRAEA